MVPSDLDSLNLEKQELQIKLQALEEKIRNFNLKPEGEDKKDKKTNYYFTRNISLDNVPLLIGDNLELEESIEDDESTKSYQTLTDGTKDWNLLFQSFLNEKHSREKYLRIASLATDFQYVAETYGRIIISEQFLPPEEKTIKESTVGGRAGGKKYICQNILFKFPWDPVVQKDEHGKLYLYGKNRKNAEKAQKAACNELKGLTAFLYGHIKEIQVPLMTLIHYRGYCLIAVSKLPINSNTIQYGSADGGEVVHNDKYLHELMQLLGKRLNLREHMVGYSGVNIIGPGDIEIHLATDGKYYVLDFGRLFPPETPSDIKPGNPVFYDLFRPLFVQEWKKPLCSDGYSGWLNINETREINRDLDEATQYLHKEIIPKFSLKLADKIARNKNMKGDLLISFLHQNGINCRHLGDVRNFLKISEKQTAEKIVLTECIARSMKNQLRKKLRKKMKQTKIATQQPFKEVVYEYFKKTLYSLPAQPTTFVSTDFVRVHEDEIVVIQGSDTSDYYAVANTAISFSTTIFYFEVSLEYGFCAGMALAPYLYNKLENKYEVCHYDNKKTYHFDSSGEFHSFGQSKDDLSPWFKGDTIGMLYHAIHHNIIITRNEKIIGTYHSIPSEYTYIPILKIGYNSRLKFNLGQKPFLFKLSSIFAISNDPAEDFWKVKDGIRKQVSTRFLNCIDKSEMDSKSDLRINTDFLLLIKRLNEMSGVQFSERLLNSSESEGVYIIESDVVDLVSRNSHIGIISHATAVYELLSVEQSPQNEDTDLAKLINAKHHLSAVLKQTKVFYIFDYYYWGSILWEISKRLTHKNEVKPNSAKKLREKAWNFFEKVDQTIKELPKEKFELMEKMKLKQGEILLRERKYPEAQVKFEQLFSQNKKLVWEKMSEVNNKSKLAPAAIIQEVYETGKVLWNATMNSKENIEFVIDYFQILCKNFSFNHGHKEDWEDTDLFQNEVKNIFLDCPIDKLREFFESFLNTDSMDGMHLAVLFKIFMEEPLDKHRGELEEVIKKKEHLIVTQNTPTLFVQTVKQFSIHCEPIIKKKLVELTILNPHVIELKFDKVHATDDLLARLPTYFKFNPNINTLDLTDNRITRINNICDVLSNPSQNVKYLNLSLSKSINDELIIQLAKCLRNNTTIISLNLWCIGMGNKGAYELAKTLQNNSNIKELDIGRNLITDEGIISVVEQISGLEAFGISYSKLNDDMLLSILKNSQSLTYLDLTGNLITDKGAVLLKEESNLRFIELEDNEIQKKYIFIDIFSTLHNHNKQQPVKVPVIAVQKHTRLLQNLVHNLSQREPVTSESILLDPKWPPRDMDSDSDEFVFD